MTVAMTAWMWFRGHSGISCAEMGAAMYLPFLALFPPMRAGWISSSDMLPWGHVLMLVARAGAMGIRPRDYAHCSAHCSALPPGAVPGATRGRARLTR